MDKRAETASEMLPEACQHYIQIELENDGHLEKFDTPADLINHVQKIHDEAQLILDTETGLNGMFEHLKKNGMACVAEIISENIDDWQAEDAKVTLPEQLELF